MQETVLSHDFFANKIAKNAKIYVVQISFNITTSATFVVRLSGLGK